MVLWGYQDYSRYKKNYDYEVGVGFRLRKKLSIKMSLKKNDDEAGESVYNYIYLIINKYTIRLHLYCLQDSNKHELLR